MVRNDNHDLFMVASFCLFFSIGCSSVNVNKRTIEITTEIRRNATLNLSGTNQKVIIAQVIRLELANELLAAKIKAKKDTDVDWHNFRDVVDSVYHNIDILHIDMTIDSAARQLLELSELDHVK